MMICIGAERNESRRMTNEEQLFFRAHKINISFDVVHLFVCAQYYKRQPTGEIPRNYRMMHIAVNKIKRNNVPAGMLLSLHSCPEWKIGFPCMNLSMENIFDVHTRCRQKTRDIRKTVQIPSIRESSDTTLGMHMRMEISWLILFRTQCCVA